jgi:hypothetical protein
MTYAPRKADFTPPRGFHDAWAVLAHRRQEHRLPHGAGDDEAVDGRTTKRLARLLVAPSTRFISELAWRDFCPKVLDGGPKRGGGRSGTIAA